MVVQPSGAVTFLFTDIEGSTRLLAKLGPDRYSEQLDTRCRLMQHAFEPRGGYEVDWKGAAFFMAFQSAIEAVAAAVEAQRSQAAHNWPQGCEFRVRCPA